MDSDQIKEAVARLTPAQRAVLEARLREKRAAAPSRAIPSRSDLSSYPLSPAQQRLWSLSRLRPDDPVYNIDAVWRLRGRLDVEALEAAVRTVVDRHEPLRYRFTPENGLPTVSLREAGEFHLGRLDLGEQPDEDVVSNELGRLTSDPFDLGNDYLIRATVVKLGIEDHVLVVVAHHIACDGWSLGILAGELGPAYEAAANGSEPQLAELAVTYSDVAQWQTDAQPGTDDLEYWSQRLSDGVEALRLPRAKSRRRAGRLDGATLSFNVDAELTAQVETLAKERRQTPFAVLLAAYQATLNRITGQESIVLCTPAAGRTRVEMEPLIGYFNNLIPLVGDLSGDPSLESTALLAATVITEAFDHSAAAFQEVAALPAVVSKPLAKGLFVLQDGQLPNPDLAGVTSSPVSHDSDSSDFDLAVFLRPTDGLLRGAVTYRPALFDQSDVTSVMADFVQVLRIMVARPATRLSELPSLRGGSRPAPDLAARPSESPTSPVEARLRQLWQKAFRRPIGVDDDFFDLGGHSLLAAQLIADIETEFSIHGLPLSTLFEAPTVARLARILADGVPEQRWESVVPIKPSGDRPPLFFVHAHGGNVIGYSDLGRHLSDRQPLYGLQAPRGDLGVRRIEDMASDYIAELRTVQPEGPYLVGGWCLGGDVALEMGHQLRRDGHHVALVLMVDNPRPEHTATEEALARPLNRALTRLEMEWANLAEAPHKPAYLKDRVGRLVLRAGAALERLITNRRGRLPFGLEHGHAYRQERVAELHEKAYETYLPVSYAGDVAVFRAELQPHGRREDPSLGWEPFVTGRLATYRLPGHRLGMLSEPRIARSAAIMEAAISRTLDGADSRDPRHIGRTGSS